jgi:hypothetical protein
MVNDDLVDTRWNLAFPPYNDLQWGVPSLNVVGVDFERSPHAAMVVLSIFSPSGQTTERSRSIVLPHVRLIAIGALEKSGPPDCSEVPSVLAGSW